MDHYDLLAPRTDRTAESVLVVSPYVESKFFERLIKDLRPATLIVVIDDGCRPDDVKMIRCLARKGTRVCVVLGSASGLVHAKIFHIQWRTAGGVRAHTLVYGSGNATRQAFETSLNSEVMCKVRLTAAKHPGILKWTAEVRAAAMNPDTSPQVAAVRDAWLAPGVEIRLPAIKIRDAKNKADNLDLWLQRGRLVSTFRRDTGFLRIQVKLRTDLPPGDEAKMIRSLGFETAQTSTLRFVYVPGAIAKEENEDGMKSWRSQLCIWTHLGDWCSDRCYLDRPEQFRRAGHQARSKDLVHLEGLRDAKAGAAARVSFVTHLEELWRALGVRAGDYLEVRDGTLHRDHYVELFDKHLARDLELAEDAEFVDRYVKGCEIIDVPRFRMDASAWRSFVASFARQLHLESLKSRRQSRLYRRIEAALADVDFHDFDDHKALIVQLRSAWNTIIEDDDGEETTVGEYITGYHLSL